MSFQIGSVPIMWIRQLIWGNSDATPSPTTFCTTFTCGKPPHHLRPTNIPQHLTLIISNFQLIKTTITLLLFFFFFLLKPICEKASAPKQIAAAGVRWCENGKLTLEDTIPCQKIKTQPWETLPLRRKTKTYCSLNPRKASSVSDLLCKSTGTVARKRKSHARKRHPK